MFVTLRPPVIHLIGHSHDTLPIKPVDGLNIFCREAGSPTRMTLILHGFPTPSNMYRILIPQLVTDYHVVAADYPGLDFSDMPP